MTDEAVQFDWRSIEVRITDVDALKRITRDQLLRCISRMGYQYREDYRSCEVYRHPEYDDARRDILVLKADLFIADYATVMELNILSLSLVAGITDLAMYERLITETDK